MQNQFTRRSFVVQSEGGSAANQSVGQTLPHLAGNIPKPISEQSAPPSQTPPPSGPEALAPRQSTLRVGYRAGGKRKIIIILIVLVLFAAIGGYLFYLSRQPKPAAQVGREKISHEQVANFARDCDLPQNEAVEYLVDEKVLSKWADDEKITLTQDEQKAEEIRISGKEATLDCVRTEAKVNLLRERLSLETKPYREGKFIAVNFGRYNPSPFGLQPAEATGQAQREKLLKEERDYADNLIQSIHSDLKTNKLTFDQAITKVNEDPKVGLNGTYSTSYMSGAFSAEDYLRRNGLFSFPNVAQIVDGLSEGKFSEPFLIKINISQCNEGEEGCQPDYADEAWVIAKVERIAEGEGDSKDDLLVKIRDKYGAKIYLK